MRVIKAQLKKQGGFTFIELIIAMALFSFVLVIISGTILQLYKIYQATVGIRNTQQTARLVVEELARESRGAAALTVVNGPAGYGQTTASSGTVSTQHDVVCFYTSDDREQGVMFYTLSTGQNQQEIWKQSLGKNDSCQRPASSSGERIANADNVSFLRFQVVATGSDLVTFRMTVASTNALQPADLDPSTVDPNNVICRGVFAAQWCSITNVSTSIALRGVNR
ncbi:prepilin-type N-terminal cleavage/methylation domain-containing protein [Patescibacteria group bacterium]|nr:MAG: prepilin-type N-terminal cleavage/methylation domain-containing protein [Patescibacteria group bacterium]